MGSKEERAQFVEMVRKACNFGKRLRELGVRPYGSCSYRLSQFSSKLGS
jgi:hypothetical protein